MEHDPASEPAGFRHRALALLIDWLICAALLAGCAIALFAATNGRSQFIPSAVPRWCQRVDPVPSRLPLPPSFSPNQATFCRYSLFGLPAAATLTLTEGTVDGYVTTNRNLVWTIDADGMAWEAGNLMNGPVEALLVLFRLLFDSVGRSPGRRICGICVVASKTGRKATFSQLWRRYLLFSIPIGVAYLAWLPGLLGASTFAQSSIGTLLAPVLIYLAFLFWTVVSINARRPTYYDRPVGTSVERV